MDTGLFSPRTIARWRWALWSVAALLLVAPAAAMLLGADGVRWGPFDFLVFGALLAAAGAAVEIGVRFSRRRTFVIALVLGVGALFVLAWAELAVGAISQLFAGQAV